MRDRYIDPMGSLTKRTTEMSRAERLLSYSLLALITSKPLATASTTVEEEDEVTSLMDKGKGTMNADGAWCWREGCTGKFNGQCDGVCSTD